MLEGSTVRSAVMVATTAAEPRPRACGWTVRSGWLHPMDTAELRQAVIPRPGVRAIEREVHTAPAPTRRAQGRATVSQHVSHRAASQQVSTWDVP
ncbi:hypothetical protein ACFTY7_44590 [Streptomyces sp. NPDC057062]|uniref:hypothetical protein n=1 Tax=Streptomyces sp. NPDC057062 TaxID=3346011 RepID=UPI0036352610